MVDFRKKILNSDKFRTPALTFLRTGVYCSYPTNSVDYFNYWDEETRRCLDGYTAPDGDYISGYNYFYLNYCPIDRITYKIIKNRHGIEERKRVQDITFPDFYDYDYYFFQAVQEAEELGRHLVVLKSRRKGYEQPYSEPVLTPTGFVPMGSLKVGDMVMNPNGNPVRIGDIVEQGITEIYEVTLQDGRKIRCGENHLWATIRNGKKFYIMRTKDYMKRKLKQGSIGKEHYPYKLPEINPLNFNSTEVPIDPYVLGVLLGDGNTCGDQVRFSTADKFILDELTHRLKDYTIKPSSKYLYCITSSNGINLLNRELKNLNLKVKANKKFIPSMYKYASIEDRMELVRGLMDTDGSISNGACSFVSTSEQLVDDLADVLRGLGIRCKKSKEIAGRKDVDFNNGSISNTLPHWELIITTQEDIFKLPRKLEKIRKDRNYNYNGIGIASIRATGEFERQRCLCIDNENHLYITKDYVPTHNSYKCGAMLCRNFYLIEGSKSYAYASEKEFLVKDGILTKAWNYLDFIDNNTAWAKKRQAVNTTMHKRASMLVTDEYGNKSEVGYKSEILGVTIKNDPDKVRGKKAKLILFEEAGKCKELGAAWQIARPSVEQDGIAFGTMIAFGTGGSEGSDFSTLREMFYNPAGSNAMEFPNIWDDASDGTNCGFFIPQYTNLDVRTQDGTRLYMDEDGNTKHKEALDYVLSLREPVIKGATDSKTVDRYIAENCLTPAEACLELTGNIFPKKDLIQQLALIRTNKKLQNHKQVGDLQWVEGLPKWVARKSGDITKYPLGKDDDPTGSIVIWEHPAKDAPFGLYIAGCDPYDHDKSGTNSLGSTFIYKRFQNFEEYYDIIVAEYTGRPSTAEEYYENVRKLLVYYNARLLYENERKGLFPYFTSKHCDYLLADQPDIISDVVGNSSVQRRKGVHMVQSIKDWGEGLIKEWLNEEYAPGRKNLTKIFSEPLLEELIQYNDKKNADRVMALMMVMIYKEQLHNLHVKKKEKIEKNNRLFDVPLFSKQWFEGGTPKELNDTPTYTF